jgi:dihydrofolate reductase
MISIIVAVAKNLAIGKGNELLWHIPEDLRHFKEVTMGHPVIMGKRTYESLPKKPLPGRKNIVITDIRDEDFPGCTAVYSIADALKQVSPEEEVFIIGGASVYKQFLPLAKRLYLTEVDKDFDGDVFFPAIDFNVWNKVSEASFEFNEKLGFSYSFAMYERK